MNKMEFLHEFKEQLKGLPESDVEEILYDYNEHFNIGINEGRSEEEIANSLGNPKALAREMRANYMIARAEALFSYGNFFRALFASVGLGFFNLVVVLGPFVGLAAGLFAIFISGVAIVASGLIIIVAILIPGIFTYTPSPLLGAFISLALISFGSLWTIGSLYLNKYFYIATIKYLKFNINIITSRRNGNE